MRTVLLIRHGDVAGDAARRYIGRTDLPMSEEGEAQIRSLAGHINSNTPPNAIYCSPLLRSRRTAEILRGNHLTPVHIQSELYEIDMGAWEGLVRSDVADHDPSAYQQRGQDIVHFRPPNGESFADVACRVLPFWEQLMATDRTGTVAIAGHAGVNRIILCHVLGVPLEHLFRIRQRPGCMNIVEHSREDVSVRFVNASCY